MSLIRWQPIRNLQSIRDRLDQLVDDMVVRGGNALLSESADCPAADIYEQGGLIVVEMQVPGYKPGEIEVAVSSRTLTVRGRRRHSGSTGKTYARRELRNGAIFRALQLPAAIDPATTKAALTDGVLTIKAAMVSKPKPPEVEAPSPAEVVGIEAELEEVVVG